MKYKQFKLKKSKNLGEVLRPSMLFAKRMPPRKPADNTIRKKNNIIIYHYYYTSVANIYESNI